MRLSEKHDSKNPAAWFSQAAERLRALNVLPVEGEGVSPTAIGALHRTMELYLKGFLLALGWQSEKTKNLRKLVDAAAFADGRFSVFKSSLIEINRDFRLTQYPGKDLRKVSDHFAIHRQIAHQLAAIIRNTLPQFFDAPTS